MLITVRETKAHKSWMVRSSEGEQKATIARSKRHVTVLMNACARSLVGAARAAAKMGDAERAGVAYANFLRQWQDGDIQLPELREAQNYLRQARVR